MSNNLITKGAVWKSEFFRFGLIVAIYLLIVGIEETAYHTFINSEWPTHTIKYTQENSPLVGEYMTTLAADHGGRVWIATNSAINVVESDGSWTIYRSASNNPGADPANQDNLSHVQSLAMDNQGQMLVGALDALFMLNHDGQWTTYDRRSTTVYEAYMSNAIVVDRFDRIWVGHDDGLRVFFPDGRKVVYTEENSGLPDNYVMALATDRYGKVWIGTRKGVSAFDQNNDWSTYLNDGPDNWNWVTAILIDDHDRVWIGTDRRGVSMLSPDGQWTTYDVTSWGRQSNPEYYDQEVNAFAMDEQGRLWIGTSDGLFALDAHGNWIAYNKVNSGLDTDWIKALRIDGSGQLWIATLQEVFVLDLRKPLPKTIPDVWRALQAILLIPIRIITTIGEWLFAPAINLAYVSAYEYAIIYIALLLMIIPATIGVLWSGRQKNQKLRNVSLWTLILLVIGVIILCLLSYLAIAIPT